VVGQSGVDTAVYTLLGSDELKKIEVRNYESMVLVSASMSGASGNRAFSKLFKYIGGQNEGATEIGMTAPVIMDDKNTSEKGTQISMTAPVFMNESAETSTMSFVMPRNFTLATTPKPIDPDVQVSALKNYKVATIQFSGTLSDSNVEKYSQILSTWIANNGYTAINTPVKASYNGPITLPMMRRNEVLIEVE
jgi:hypothetical protein